MPSARIALYGVVILAVSMWIVAATRHADHDPPDGARDFLYRREITCLARWGCSGEREANHPHIAHATPPYTHASRT